MLLHRYHNIEFILQLDADTAMDLIREAQKQAQEERIFQQWVAQLPMMAFSGVSVSFADYRDRVTGANIDRRSTAEIMADVDAAERELQRGGDA